MSVRHLILDRDGVLNCENPDGGWITSTADWRWEGGALEALVKLTQAGFSFSVVTNQSVVGRGLASLSDIQDVLAHMEEEAAAAGVYFASIQFCPHAPNSGCDCRKPAPGMIEEAVYQSGLSKEEALFVGDSKRDLLAGHLAGVAVALVRTGKGLLTEQKWVGPVEVYDDLLALAEALMDHERRASLEEEG
jgi:D-glycero-D-manno-heptose 1,7-bisphosphate phosphatase